MRPAVRQRAALQAIRRRRPPHCAQNAERRQILNDLVEMVSGQATELVGYLLDIDVLTRFLAPEQHQDAKGDIGRGEEAH